MQQQLVTGRGFEDKIRFLSDPKSYSEEPAFVEHIETHFSFILFLDSIVFKLKKPVQTDFIDLRTIDARTFCVREEMRLNKRLAPDTYIGIIPIYYNQKGFNFKGEGEISDWMVKMHKLPSDKMLDYSIKNKTVVEAELRKVAQVLSSFYLNSKREIVQWNDIKSKMEQEIESYRKVVSHLTDGSYIPKTVQFISDTLLKFIDNNQELFEERISGHNYVEGHGDLRPEHICLTDPPQIFDCLEFEKSLRIIDPAEELSFLAMECELLGSDHVGQYMFEFYQQYTNDIIPLALILFYKAKRAFLRAKLTAGHLLEAQYKRDNHWGKKTQVYIELCKKYIDKLVVV